MSETPETLEALALEAEGSIAEAEARGDLIAATTFRTQAETIRELIPVFAVALASQREEIARLKTDLATETLARISEVDHWVARYNEIEKWRSQTAVLKAKAESRLTEQTATVERLRELSATWRTHSAVTSPRDEAPALAFRRCADELDAALKERTEP